MKPPVADKTDKPAAKSAPKVFDISHPGKTAANSTARPVIVANRPMLQDPMVDKPEAEPLPSAPKLSPAAVKVTIKPLDDDAPISVSVDSSDQPDKAEKSVRNGDKTIAELAAEAITGKPAVKQDKETSERPEPKPTSEDARAEDKPAEPKTEDKPASESETEPAEDSGSKVADSSEGDTGPEELAVEDSKEAKETAQLEAEAKKQEAIDALADSRQYFLPINSAERHRSKVISLLGLLLILALGLLLFDLLLDVGFIRLHGIHSVTHFFSV